jgi:hypothetical protein
MTRQIAIIGTAGPDKDKTELMTKRLWEAMLADAVTRIQPDDHLYSGGAAWVDHLAIKLFLSGHGQGGLDIFLPCPIDDKGRFVGPPKSSASAANYYHEKFSRILQVDTRLEIASVDWCYGSLYAEPSAPGYGGTFARNKKVAERVNACIAYTWGEGDEPADGGTKNTWDQITGDRVHVPLRGLLP